MKMISLYEANISHIVANQAHHLEVGGSNPPPVINNPSPSVIIQSGSQP